MKYIYNDIIFKIKNKNKDKENFKYMNENEIIEKENDENMKENMIYDLWVNPINYLINIKKDFFFIKEDFINNLNKIKNINFTFIFNYFIIKKYINLVNINKEEKLINKEEILINDNHKYQLLKILNNFNFIEISKKKNKKYNFIILDNIINLNIILNNLNLNGSLFLILNISLLKQKNIIYLLYLLFEEIIVIKNFTDMYNKKLYILCNNFNNKHKYKIDFNNIINIKDKYYLDVIKTFYLKIKTIIDKYDSITLNKKTYQNELIKIYFKYFNNNKILKLNYEKIFNNYYNVYFKNLLKFKDIKLNILVINNYNNKLVEDNYNNYIYYSSNDNNTQISNNRKIKINNIPENIYTYNNILHKINFDFIIINNLSDIEHINIILNIIWYFIHKNKYLLISKYYNINQKNINELIKNIKNQNILLNDDLYILLIKN